MRIERQDVLKVTPHRWQHQGRSLRSVTAVFQSSLVQVLRTNLATQSQACSDHAGTRGRGFHRAPFLAPPLVKCLAFAPKHVWLRQDLLGQLTPALFLAAMGAYF